MMSNEVDDILEDVAQFDIESAIEYLLRISTNSKQEKILRAIQQRFFPEESEVVSVDCDCNLWHQLLCVAHEKNLTVNQYAILCLENYIKETGEQNHGQDTSEDNS